MSTQSVLELNEQSFAEQVSAGVVLVDFWAPWCGPCRMMAPVLEAVATEMQGTAMVAKVDVDQSPDLASAFGVRSIPALFVLRDGQVVDQLVGVQSTENLVAVLRRHALEREASA